MSPFLSQSHLQDSPPERIDDVRVALGVDHNPARTLHRGDDCNTAGDPVFIHPSQGEHCRLCGRCIECLHRWQVVDVVEPGARVDGSENLAVVCHTHCYDSCSTCNEENP